VNRNRGAQSRNVSCLHIHGERQASRQLGYGCDSIWLATVVRDPTDEGTEGFMVVNGANVNFDADGKFLSIVDAGWIEQAIHSAAKAAGQTAQRYCRPKFAVRREHPVVARQVHARQRTRSPHSGGDGRSRRPRDGRGRKSQCCVRCAANEKGPGVASRASFIER
jgi:hypothetical protein